MNKLANTLAILPLALMPFAAISNDGPDDDDDTDVSLIVGVGYMMDSGVYQDIGSQTQVIPLVYGQIGDFSFKGTGIAYNAFANDWLTLSPFVDFNAGGGYEQSDVDNGSQLYDGLTDLENAFEAGIEAEIEAGAVDVSLSYRTDISDTHSGDIAEISVSNDYLFLENKLVLIPELGAKWVSKSFNQYYFGVDEANATEFRPAYQAGSGINYELSLTAIGSLADNWKTLFRTSYEIYGSSIKDSHLVESNSELSVIVGVGYEF